MSKTTNAGTTRRMLQDRRLVPLTQGAELIMRHPQTLRDMIREGTITGYKIGRLVYVDREELEAQVRPIVSSEFEAEA